jgi:hypothetical protein
MGQRGNDGSCVVFLVCERSLSGGVHHWLKSRSTREERKPVTRDDDDEDNNNNNNNNKACNV